MRHLSVHWYVAGVGVHVSARLGSLVFTNVRRGPRMRVVRFGRYRVAWPR